MNKFNILYSGDQRQDLQNVCEYIDGFCHAVSMPYVDLNTIALMGVLTTLQQDFPYQHGPQKASPFKKVAAFTTAFVAAKPILTPLPEDKFGLVAGCQNAILAYEFSIDALHGAEINCQKRKKIIVLENRIKISKHYWMDLIKAISACAPVYHFELLSLLYEALAYRWNTDASYTPTI